MPLYTIESMSYKNNLVLSQSTELLKKFKKATIESF